MAVFDFDGVLFDALRFKKDYESLFFRAGISKETYEKSYTQAKKKGYYDPRIHIKLAVGGLRAGSVIEKNLYARMTEFTKKTSSYIYPDVAEFITFLGDENIRAILLSTGDAVFQHQKISKSGIADLFDEIVIIPEASKVSALHSLIRKEQPLSAVFIDDKKEVLEEVKKSLPRVYVVQMRRTRQQPSKGDEASDEASDVTLAPARRIDMSVHDFAGLADFIKDWKTSSQ